MAKKKMTADDLDFVKEKENGSENTVPQSRIYNQIFGVPGESYERLADVNINDIEDFPNHPFKVNIDNEMTELRDSIKQNGVLSPVIIRDNGNGKYTMLAGHRRKKAASLAGMMSVPAIIKSGITDDEAILIMVDSNQQREVILPSERAFALKMKNDAMKRQGARNDLKQRELRTPSGRSSWTSEILAEQEGLGKSSIKNYIRLTHLIPELLDLVDNSVLKNKSMPEMAIKPAVEISYLQPDEQLYFYETVKTLSKTPSVQQARMIKEMSAKNALTQTEVMKILIEDKPNQKETVKVDSERLGSYFRGSYTPRELEGKVFERLESYDRINSIIEKYTPKNKINLTENDKAAFVENTIKFFIDHSKQQTR